MTDKTPQILPRKPGEPGGEKATAKKLVSKLREAGLDNIKIQEAADERFIPTAYDSMRQAFNTRMDDLEAGVAGALAACALEEAREQKEVLRAARKFVRGRHSVLTYGPQSLLDQLDHALARIAALERAAEGKA